MTKEERLKLFEYEFSEALEILDLLSASLAKIPSSCECDFELEDGRWHGTKCLAHKAEEFLNELGL